jgi:hypothetical protein
MSEMDEVISQQANAGSWTDLYPPVMWKDARHVVSGEVLGKKQDIGAFVMHFRGFRGKEPKMKETAVKEKRNEKVIYLSFA